MTNVSEHAMFTKQKFKLKENVQFITGQQMGTSNPGITITLRPFGIKSTLAALSCRSTFGIYVMKMLD